MTTDTIAEQVSTMHAGLANQPPNEIMGAFAPEQADLAARGTPSGVAATGASLPDADLLDAHGTPTTLHDVTDGRPAVIVFYRGAWVPLLQPRPQRLPGPAPTGIDRTRREADCRQPPRSRTKP
jgi:Redoxin